MGAGILSVTVYPLIAFSLLMRRPPEPLDVDESDGSIGEAAGPQEESTSEGTV